MKGLQKTIDNTPVTVTNTGKLSEISQPRSVLQWGIDEGLVETPSKESSPRNPQIVSGCIREVAELIVYRPWSSDGQFAEYVDAQGDAQRILALLDELDSGLLQQQLTASVKGRK